LSNDQYLTFNLERRSKQALKPSDSFNQEDLSKMLSNTDESDIAMMLSLEKFHAHLLNSMNIRVDETLSDYFFNFKDNMANIVLYKC
jgi:hypothetical protein